MNAKLLTPAEINALNTAGQRAYAKEIDVKRAASDTKATLGAKLLNRTLEIEKEQAAAAAPAKPVKAKTSKKICNVCNKRRAGNDVGISDMCQPCADEGGWENTHNDNGHTDLRAKADADLTEAEKVELASYWLTECWICFPEKNKAQRDPKTRGSKEGMKVVAKGDKITLVVEALKGMGATVKTDTTTGITALVANLPTALGGYHIEAAWIGAAFHYPAASFNGKKFRNVAELFRMLGLN